MKSPYNAFLLLFSIILFQLDQKHHMAHVNIYFHTGPHTPQSLTVSLFYRSQYIIIKGLS